MEENILTQEDDAIEEEMKKAPVETKADEKPNPEQDSQEAAHETYEAFSLPARLGITNTLTGESLEGFDYEKDTALVMTLNVILNKLDKIAIAAGA